MFVVPEEMRPVHPGQKFKKLTVCGATFFLRSPASKNRFQHAVCQCECGRYGIFRVYNLLGRGHQGCMACRTPSRRKKDRPTPAYRRDGRSKTRLYNILRGMKQRCGSPKAANYRRYGGRGIYVCDEWVRSFHAFREWAERNGYHDRLQIDRIDNDGPYAPWNCRWVTSAQNSSNRTKTLYVVAWGECKLLTDWIRDERCRARYACVQKRIRMMGWNPEDAISTPAMAPQRNLGDGEDRR